MNLITQEMAGGPREGGSGEKLATTTHAVCAGGADALAGAVKKWSQVLGKGASRSNDSRQNGQCSNIAGVSGTLLWLPLSGLASVATVPVRVSTDWPSAIQRGPLLVQISTHWLLGPRVACSACDSGGASAPSTATHSASHTAQGRRSGSTVRAGCIGRLVRQDLIKVLFWLAYCRAWNGPWRQVCHARRDPARWSPPAQSIPACSQRPWHP